MLKSPHCGRPWNDWWHISRHGGSSTPTTAVHTEPIVRHTTPPVHCSSSQSPGVLNKAPRLRHRAHRANDRTGRAVPLPEGGTNRRPRGELTSMDIGDNSLIPTAVGTHSAQRRGSV